MAVSDLYVPPSVSQYAGLMSFTMSTVGMAVSDVYVPRLRYNQTRWLCLAAWPISGTTHIVHCELPT